MRSHERLALVSVMSAHVHSVREMPVGAPARWIVSKTRGDHDR